MAADVIQAQYEPLETIAARFGRQAEASRSIETSVARSLRSLQSGGWEGRGAAAFFDEMTGSVLPALARLAQALQQAQTVTLQIKAVLRAAEEEAGQPFHGPAEAAAPAQEASGSWWDGAKEWLHGALDVAGLIPGFGEIADGANALIYLAEGRFVEAGISAVAMIPILGDVGKAGKWGVKAGKELLEEGAERAAKEGAETLVDKVTGRLTPEIGEKLKFIFGQATGSIHNIDRSRDMLRQLERIGLADNPNSREYIFKHLSNVLNDPSNIAKLQKNGRVIKESLLMGPKGALKMESIWQNDKLITIILKGGY